MNEQFLIISQDQTFIKKCLNCTNFTVASAITEADAIRQMQNRPFTAVIVDLRIFAEDAAVLLAENLKQIESVVMLAAPDNSIPRALSLLNRHGFYRLFPLSIASLQLAVLFEDGANQFKRMQHTELSDRLTGCFTRETFIRKFGRELQRSVRYNRYLAIILCDLDHLEAINKTYGRDCGDSVLRAFADAARSLLRKDIDWISRYQDDSFFIVLPETEIRGAGVVAERLKTKTANLQTYHQFKEVQATASFGVAGYSPGSPAYNRQLNELLTTADHCLLQAKAEGGNQVLCCP